MDKSSIYIKKAGNRTNVSQKLARYFAYLNIEYLYFVALLKKLRCKAVKMFLVALHLICINSFNSITIFYFFCNCYSTRD